MTQKLLATCVAAAAIAGAAAAGITAAVSIKPSASPAVKPVVFGAPLPLDPATDPVADVPTAEQIIGVLNGLADPGIPFASKAYLVEGGIGRIEARTADALMRNAVAVDHPEHDVRRPGWLEAVPRLRRHSPDHLQRIVACDAPPSVPPFPGAVCGSAGLSSTSCSAMSVR